MFQTIWQRWLKQPSSPTGVGIRKSRSRQSTVGPLQVEQLEDRTVPTTIVYNQITSLPSSNPLNADAPFNLLDANGDRVVFNTYINGVNPVYTINADGTNQIQIDPNAWSNGNGLSDLDISANGQLVLESITLPGNSGHELRLVNADGTNVHDAIVLPGAGYSSVARLSPDGTTVFFAINIGFTSNSQQFPAGFYSVPETGGTPTLIASQTQVATLVGTTAGNITLTPSEGIDQGVSADGTHLVFGVAENNVGDFLVGVNSNGTNLHAIGALPQSGDSVSEAGISGDGTKVFRYDSGNAVANGFLLTVYNFDGSGQVTVNVPSGQHALTTGPEHVQLTQDGSKLLLGGTSLLLNTDNSGLVQIGTDVGLGTSGLPNHSLVNPSMYHATMNGSGTEFLYATGDLNDAYQLAIAQINPSSLGVDPAISNVTINPSYLLTQQQSSITVSATVSANTTPAGVSEAFMLNGEDELNEFSDTTLANMGNGFYSTSGITTHSTITGPRDLRVSAETVDGNGLQHVTTVEVSGLNVVTQAPAGVTATITPVSPNPHTTSVNALTITFSGPVTGFTLNALQLKGPGGTNLLTAVQTLTTTDNQTFTLGNLAGLTDPTHRVAGFTLTLTAAGSGINGTSGGALTTNATMSFVELDPALSLSGTSLTITGTAGNDNFAFVAGPPEQAVLNGTTYTIDKSVVTAIQYVTGGGNDFVSVYGLGSDTATFTRSSATVSTATDTGPGYVFTVSNSFSTVFNSSGATSTATFQTTNGVDSFIGTPTYSATNGASNSYFDGAVGFHQTSCVAGGTNSIAYLVTSAGATDTFTGGPTSSDVQGTSYQCTATGFTGVAAYAGSTASVANLTIRATGTDICGMVPAYSVVQAANFAYFVYAVGYAKVNANANGNTAAIAYLGTSTSADTYNGSPTSSQILGANYNNTANNFQLVEAFGNAASTANFTCSGNNDTFNRTNDNSGDVTGTYKFYAIGFGTVVATAATGSNCTANFFDSPGNDTFTEVAPTTGILTGTNTARKALASGP